MSWSLYATGTKAGVEQYIREAKAHMEVDRITFELAKEVVIGEVQKVETNGVQVEANGHAGNWSHMKVAGVHLYGV